jgi:hypothetical protein
VSEGIYCVKIHNCGKLEPVLLDDYIPFDQEKGPFVTTPTNQSEAEHQVEEKNSRQMSPSKKVRRKRNLSNEADLWPHLLAKGLAKSLNCYERLLIQGIPSMLGDISGMPVKTYGPENIDFNLLRQGFKRKFIMVRSV